MTVQTPLQALAGEVSVALADIRRRLDALEAQANALAPLLESDRLEVARTCSEVGATADDIRSRSTSATRAEAVRRVFKALRCKGWPVDRIARATGYTARGVASNLRVIEGTE